MELGIESNKINRLAEEISTFKKQTGEKVEKNIERSEEILEEVTKMLSETKKINAKIQSDFESMTNEIVDVLREIRSQGLKGDRGEDGVNGKDAVLPNIEEIVDRVSVKVKPTPASLKIIKESVELKDEEIVPKLNKASNLGDLTLSIENIKDWPKKWGDIKAEISRSKQGFHGGGFNNIASASATVSTGLDTLKFTGAGVASVTQTGRTVTVDISGGSSLSVLAATGTIDDSNTVFTFISAPTLVVVNGAAYASTSTVGGTLAWTAVGTTVTLAFAVGTGGSIYALG